MPAKPKPKPLPTIPKLKSKAQTVFNKYIRTRDTLPDNTFTCIACLKTYPLNKMQAGHFYGTKLYNWLRFNEDNCHSECIYCNNFNHESLIGYTLNLPNKIGDERFQTLRMLSNIKQPEFNREELEAIIIKYKNIL